MNQKHFTSIVIDLFRIYLKLILTSNSFSKKTMSTFLRNIKNHLNVVLSRIICSNDPLSTASRIVSITIQNTRSDLTLFTLWLWPRQQERGDMMRIVRLSVEGADGEPLTKDDSMNKKKPLPASDIKCCFRNCFALAFYLPIFNLHQLR